MKPLKPYICTTGFDESSQIDELNIKEQSHSKIVCGCLVSHDSIWGFNKLRFPAVSELKEIGKRVKDKGYDFAIHYCPKKSGSAVAKEDMHIVLEELNPDMIQINCANPEVIESIFSIIENSSLINMEVVFQMNRTIINKFGKHSLVCEYFKKLLNGNKGHCLYDLSGGNGIEINEEGLTWDDGIKLHSQLGMLMGDYDLCPGVAGGLSHENVAKWVKRFGNDISIDCESKVRNAYDKIVMEYVNQFYNDAILAKG